MMAQRIVVTGAAGQAGRAVVADLREHGYDVTPTDVVVSAANRDDGMLKADLCDYGQAVEVLAGQDAVVHLANIPAPGLSTPGGHVQHEHHHELQRLPGRRGRQAQPRGVGLQRDHARPAVRQPAPVRPGRRGPLPGADLTYALSKVASETIAGHIAEWSGIPFVALRFSNIMDPEWYQEYPSYQDDAAERKWNLWGYIDQRDVAQACRKALEVDASKIQGSPAFIIAAADTVMNRPSAELLAEVYPGVKLTRDVGEHGTLLAIDRAREVLGFTPSTPGATTEPPFHDHVLL